MKKEKELNSKEKILEAFRKGTKLSWTKLALAFDEDRVFQLKPAPVYLMLRDTITLHFKRMLYISEWTNAKKKEYGQ